MRSLLKKEIAEQAISIVAPAINAMFETGLAKRKALAVVVLEIGLLDVLAERPFGDDPSTWEHPYDDYACAKARLSQRTKMDTLEVVYRLPHLLEECDCKYPGGVYREGIAVGASGADWWIDQMVAEMVAATCRALCITRAQKLLASPGPYVPNPSFLL